MAFVSTCTNHRVLFSFFELRVKTSNNIVARIASFAVHLEEITC